MSKYLGALIWHRGKKCRISAYGVYSGKKLYAYKSGKQMYFLDTRAVQAGIRALSGRY